MNKFKDKSFAEVLESLRVAGVIVVTDCWTGRWWVYYARNGIRLSENGKEFYKSVFQYCNITKHIVDKEGEYELQEHKNHRLKFKQILLDLGFEVRED